MNRLTLSLSDAKVTWSERRIHISAPFGGGEPIRPVDLEVVLRDAEGRVLHQDVCPLDRTVAVEHRLEYDRYAEPGIEGKIAAAELTIHFEREIDRVLLRARCGEPPSGERVRLPLEDVETTAAPEARVESITMWREDDGSVDIYLEIETLIGGAKLLARLLRSDGSELASADQMLRHRGRGVIALRRRVRGSFSAIEVRLQNQPGSSASSAGPIF